MFYWLELMGAARGVVDRTTGRAGQGRDNGSKAMRVRFVSELQRMRGDGEG